MTIEIRTRSEDLHDGVILKGESLLQLPIETLTSYAQQISNALSLHADTMIQYTPDQILQIVREKRAIIVTDQKKKQCNAFAQLHLWKSDSGDSPKPGAIEMRSWLSWSNGNGRLVVLGAIELSSQLFPDVPLCAIVADHNDNAKEKLLKYGAEPMVRPSCIACDLKDGDTIIPTIAILLSSIK